MLPQVFWQFGPCLAWDIFLENQVNWALTEGVNRWQCSMGWEQVLPGSLSKSSPAPFPQGGHSEGFHQHSALSQLLLPEFDKIPHKMSGLTHLTPRAPGIQHREAKCSSGFSSKQGFNHGHGEGTGWCPSPAASPGPSGKGDSNVNSWVREQAQNKGPQLRDTWVGASKFSFISSSRALGAPK